MTVTNGLRTLLGVLLIAGASAADVSAQVWREVTYAMDNRLRHVVGEVNAECPPSWHTAGWGNWGVQSNASYPDDTDQFRGWKAMNNGQAHWNSCTEDHIRDTDFFLGGWYNHDHTGNGLGDDQCAGGDAAWQCPGGWYPYAGASVEYGTSCPYDSDSDGYCDSDGCLPINISGFGVGNTFMSLYELDWDGHDFISTLSIGSCCTAYPSCNANNCGEATTPWQGTTGWSDTEITADIRLRVMYAEFRDPNGDCAFWAQWDPRYNCW